MGKKKTNKSALGFKEACLEMPDKTPFSARIRDACVCGLNPVADSLRAVLCSSLLLYLSFTIGLSLCPRDIFDELLETEKNAQPLSMEVGRSVRQPLWRVKHLVPPEEQGRFWTCARHAGVTNSSGPKQETKGRNMGRSVCWTICASPGPEPHV